VICLFSTIGDQTTTDVMRWLHYMGKHDVIRVNANDPDNNHDFQLDLSGDSFSFQYAGRSVQLQDLEAVWYRKGRNWLCDPYYPVSVEDHQVFSSYLNNKLKAEESTLGEYLHYLIQHVTPVLGSSTKGNLNKLLVLALARESGLKIPDFHITNHKKGAQALFNSSPGLITKAVSDGLYLFENRFKGKGYFSYTEAVDQEMIDDLPNQMAPSFFQVNIRKKYEVRVFFLDNTCHSMAILSQCDEQTKTDYRRYNEKKPNRYVPFRLPPATEQQIKQLFNKLDLNTGSVDLILDEQDNFYFLEINPVGQFGMVSEPCNYFLEKEVALKLMSYARKNSAN